MPNFKASNDRPVETTNGGDGSDESQHSKRRLPSNTLAALGVLPDEIQTRIRDIKLPEELKSLTEPQLLCAIIDFFSANETSTRVARIADKALYETAEELNRKAGLSIESIHDFANRYFAVEGDASKPFLIYSISSFLEDLYRVYGELNELLLEAERKKHNPHKLELPDLCISNKCDVLRPSVSEHRWESAGTFSLERPSLPSPNKIADVVNYSYKINPHSHLLVEGHYVVSPEGSVQIVSVPQLPSSPNHQLGKSSMTLRFNREYSGNNAPEISRFSITTIRKLDSSNADSAQYEVTYTADPEKERGISHSPLSCHKAELCVPETFTKLVGKFAELNLSIEEKAQLVAQFFSSQKLIYSHHPQLSELLSACDSKHRISLVLGLGVGDCLSLALVLQQLLAHAGVSAAVEWGAVCSADGKSYKSPPSHARVKVYGSDSILRLDPTTWCVRNISIGTMEGKSLGALKCELVNADAKTSYQVGQRARRLITTAALGGSDGRSAISRSDIRNTDARKNAPSSINGHRLKDDFNHRSKAKLHRLLAANEQEVLVAQVWEAYEKALESAQYDAFSQDVGILLQEEVKLVGLQQSKICAALPKMVQTIYRVGRPSTLFFCDLIERIQSPEAQAYLLSHTLNRNTLSDCVEFLFTGTLPPSAESTRFLVRLIHLIADVRGTDLSDDGAHTCQVLLLQAAQFPKHYRDSITRAFSNTFGEDLDCLINLLCSSCLFAKDRPPVRRKIGHPWPACG
jgi:hypothetical protein